jgi:hypothetical protein
MASPKGSIFPGQAEGDEDQEYWGCRTCTMLNELSSNACAFCRESKDVGSMGFKKKDPKKADAKKPALMAVGYDERMLLHVQPVRKGTSANVTAKQRAMARANISEEDIQYMAEDSSDDDADDEAARHPERPDRVRSIFKYLHAQDLMRDVIEIPGREASRSELVSVHSDQHIAKVRASARRQPRRGRPV